ncbi:unnamed protein product [Pedinophyceae sp. YPF-701]|nr:unnamed protein product [Pedinophyceae sp. YPF-701]
MLTPEDKEAVEVVRLMLKQAAMHRVRRELKVLAADRPAIPEAEFRRLLIDKQVATTPEESEEMFKALVTAGVVLPYHRVIYLKPDEIMGKMIEMLPDAHETPMEIEEHIREVETEYVPLAEQRQSFSNVARRRAATLFGLGVAGLAAWGVVMVRLTWWELSWDVIEPIAYFSGLVGNIALWSYSMRARHDPTYENIFQRMVRRYEDKRMQLEGFDLERYKDMEATLDRLRERRRMMRLVNQPSG